jgi:hypothetical protein
VVARARTGPRRREGLDFEALARIIASSCSMGLPLARLMIEAWAHRGHVRIVTDDDQPSGRRVDPLPGLALPLKGNTVTLPESWVDRACQALDEPTGPGGGP